MIESETIAIQENQKVKDLEFFDKAVTNLLPPPLVQMMGAFGGEVKEEALKLKYLTEEEFDMWVDPKKMTGE